MNFSFYSGKDFQIIIINGEKPTKKTNPIKTKALEL
jgi:hypothetical protein